ncbi:hypothetical protein [Asanoa iriomotensis]|uniref:Uncharacterized protein n=1 Tax=Asanoa iriomotensis TaxID=234613 RepID=A0ABQ4CFZ5_9ACTN|nr:hypothetical protein [Asanoa iriomotensis]GIF61702.1 hypothetical protein Air01nite_77970 [Asanoa iriomotensis]
MSATVTALDHLLSVFGTHTRVEQLEEFLRTVSGHHTELAEHLRGQLDAGGFTHAHSLITPAGARQLATIHDASAADAIAMADSIAQALNPDTEEDQ